MVLLIRPSAAVLDDNTITAQIQATHDPSDQSEIDVKPLFNVVESILQRTTLEDITEAQLKVDDKIPRINFAHTQASVSTVIDQLASQISFNSLREADAHEKTLSLFNMLAHYSWDAKLVLVMAAFALNRVLFFLLVQLYPSDQLGMSLAIIKRLPVIPNDVHKLKVRFHALNNLIKVMIDVTKCVIELWELPSMYISMEVPALSAVIGHVPNAAYWTVRSVVACATQIAMETEDKDKELSSLTERLTEKYVYLREQLNICQKHIEEKKSTEDFLMLLNFLDTTHDNTMILKKLIPNGDDNLPLVEGRTKKLVGIDVLSKKTVLLLISGLDFSHNEFMLLEQIYMESSFHRRRQGAGYEMVWVPIMDNPAQWNDEMEKQIEQIQLFFPWYSLRFPPMEKSVVRLINEVWHFRNKSIIVTLDPEGSVVCLDALNMMFIFGSFSFPFTKLNEESLWKDQKFRLELLVDGIDPSIMNWIQEGKYIFLYGGDDIEWVREFLKTTRAVAKDVRILVEMAYLGKSSNEDKVQHVIRMIGMEKLSHTLEEPVIVWYFWNRLERILSSMFQVGNTNFSEHNLIMQETMKLLSYDKEGGWAMLCRGSDVVVNGPSSTVLRALKEFDQWKENVSAKGFEISFKEYYDKLHDDDDSGHCCCLSFPSAALRIPRRMICPECGNMMERQITLLCCDKDSIAERI